jgi:hypothetical protein
MTEYDRQGARTVAIHDGEIGVAEAGRRHADQHFSGAGAVEIDRFDGNGLRFRIGKFHARLVKYGGTDFQICLPGKSSGVFCLSCECAQKARAASPPAISTL